MTLQLVTIIVLALCIAVIAWLVYELSSCTCVKHKGAVRRADAADIPRRHPLPPLPPARHAPSAR